MKNRKTLFCDKEFINALDDKGKIMFSSLCDESCIVVNEPSSSFRMKAFTDNTIKMMEKKRNDGLCNITYKDFISNSIQQDEDVYTCYCPIVLIKQSQKERRENNLCYQYELYGLACYDQTNFKDIENLNDDNGFAIKKGEHDSWCSRLENVKHLGNAMVIIDPYLIADTQTYEKNIYDILETLLPDKVEKVFHLTIIAHNDITGQKDGQFTYKQNWNDCYGMISSFVREKKPKLKIKINMLNDVDKTFHDRIILTNYFTITCGAGFDLFKKNGSAKHTTTISFLYPFIQKHIRWAIDNYINQLETARDVSELGIHYGDNEGNRLFRLKGL